MIIVLCVLALMLIAIVGCMTTEPLGVLGVLACFAVFVCGTGAGKLLSEQCIIDALVAGKEIIITQTKDDITKKYHLGIIQTETQLFIKDEPVKLAKEKK